MKNNPKNYTKISFLSSDIEKLDEIISKYTESFQTESDSATLFMIAQYEFRRAKLYRLLCIELLSLPMESSVNYLPLVQNIAKLYTESQDLQTKIKEDIQKWAV